LVIGGEWMTFKSTVRELRGETREGKRRSGCYFGRGVEEAGDLMAWEEGGTAFSVGRRWSGYLPKLLDLYRNAQDLNRKQ
jgi:hypothetical protein